MSCPANLSGLHVWRYGLLGAEGQAVAEYHGGSITIWCFCGARADLEHHDAIRWLREGGQP